MSETNDSNLHGDLLDEPVEELIASRKDLDRELREKEFDGLLSEESSVGESL